MRSIYQCRCVQVERAANFESREIDNSNCAEKSVTQQNVALHVGRNLKKH